MPVPRRGRWLRVVVTLAIVFAVAVPSRGEAADLPGSFHLVFVHPDPAAQPTAVGRRITELQAFGGRLYAGYGDYGANGGPLTVSSYDPATGDLERYLATDTDAVYNYRPIGSTLYAPATDPRLTADFASGPPWSDQQPLNSLHVFDIVARPNGELWAVGSKGVNAAAWRSVDGGKKWALALKVAPVHGITNDFARFYFAGVQGPRLHLQAHDFYGGRHPTSRVLDGGTWSTGPDLFPTGGWGWRPVQFGGRMVYHATGHTRVANVLAFDGTTPSVVGRGYDVESDGQRVYILESDGDVVASDDFQTWSLIGTGPKDTNGNSTATSLTILDGTVYLGTADSRLFRFVRDDTTPPTAPDGLDASATRHDRVSLSWEPAVDPENGIEKYRVHRDGVVVGSSKTPSFVDTGLAASTTYEYEITAVTAGTGVEGPPSSQAEATTPADTTPPVLVSAGTDGRANRIVVRFDEPVNTSTATDPSTYHLNNGATVSSANLAADGRTVELSTSPLGLTTAYTLTVDPMPDRADPPNVSAASSRTVRVSGDGLAATYFDDASLTVPVLSRVDPLVSFVWGAEGPVAGVEAETFGVRWTGKVLVPASETVTFTAAADDGVRLWVDGVLVMNGWQTKRLVGRSGKIALQAGLHDLRVDYFDQNREASISLSWKSPTIKRQLIPTERLFSTGP